MAKLKIRNEQYEDFNVNGKMTFKVSKVLNEEGDEQMVCFGQLATHKYFETIQEIETDRYILRGVEVTDETFGTNDFNILYEFEAQDWEVKEEYLSEETIEMIEKEEYKDDEGDKFMEVNRGERRWI